MTVNLPVEMTVNLPVEMTVGLPVEMTVGLPVEMSVYSAKLDNKERPCRESMTFLST